MKDEEYFQISRIKDNITITLQITDNSTYFKRSPTNTVEKLALLLKLYDAFGYLLTDAELLKKAEEWQKYKQKLDTEQMLKQQKEHEEYLKQQKEPLAWFTRILRNNWHITNPEEVDLWLSETTLQQRKMVLEEFKQLAKKRGLGLRKETIEFGLVFLQSSLSHNNNNQSREGKHSWIHKLMK